MSGLEKFYDLSPVVVQNLMVSGKGLLNTRSRYGKEYYEHREFLSLFDTWTIEEKLEYQRKELVRLIRHAAANSPYYRDLYHDADLSRIRTVGDLRILPFIDKEMLRENHARVLAVPRSGSMEWHTGGTTGKSLVVRGTRVDLMKRMAMLDHFKARHGFEHRQMRRATFNGKHIVPPSQAAGPLWRYNASCKQMIFSSFHLTESNMGRYIDELNRFKPQAIDGFFTCIVDIASYIERHEYRLDFKPVAIFPTSETLTPTGRALIERVFGCGVYDQYASSEGAPFVTECPHRSLHVELASGVFERLDDSGEVLVTSFTTYGTPLIRYRIGDRMVLDEHGECSCGDPSPLVRSIEGRRLDYLYTADGAKINAGNVANLFKNMPNALVRAQLVQRKLGEVIALLEVDTQLYRPEYDDLLRDEFVHKFGVDTQLRIEHVTDIPRERSGKLRFIRNEVKDA